MNGGVFLTTNNGATWSALNTGLTNNWVTALTFVGNNFFAGTNGGVFLSTNSGASWTAINSGLGGGQNVWALAVSGSNLFAGTAGGVFRSTNNGTSWTAASSGLTSTFVLALAVSGTNLFAGTTNGLFFSTDNGANWKTVNTGLTNTSIHAFAVSGSNVLAGTDGGVFLTTNNGASWTSANNGIPTTSYVAAFAVSGTSIVAGTSGHGSGGSGIYLSTNNGTTWVSHNPGLGSVGGTFAMAVCGSYLFCGGQGGSVWRRPLSELTNYWVSQTSPLGTQSLGQIQFVSPTEGWIAAGNGQLLHTTNSAASWSAVTACGSDTVSVICDPSRSMSFINATNGWAIGTLGSLSGAKGAVLYHTTNSGASWSKQLPPSWSMGLFVQFVDANNGWAVVANGGGSSNITSSAIIRTTNGGTNWISLPVSLGIPYFIDANNGWCFNASPGGVAVSYIWRTTNGGTSWNTQLTDSSSGRFLNLQFIDLNNGWVVGDSGKLFRTTDGGTNWTRITNTGNISNHNAVFFLDANVGWIGSRVSGNQDQGIILHTTNGGGSWTIQDTPSQNDIFSIYFVDANNGWLTGDNGVISRTTSAGATSVREESPGTIPSLFQLKQNYPNPFNPTTFIQYDLPASARVCLTVYDVLGREVATLVDEVQQAGSRSVEFNAGRLASGLYYYRLQAGTFTETKKLVLLK
jgi:photosystem II stability/assembly factor-like uncharacterized protein